MSKNLEHSQVSLSKHVAGSTNKRKLDGRLSNTTQLQSTPKKSKQELSPSNLSSRWPFPTDYNDHFETSFQAIVDLEPALFKLCQLLNKDKKQLIIYDPYFCQGSIKQHYEKLGFERIINENRDFYHDIDNNTLPEYDVLITNPPYSEDHKKRILQFCIASDKPWALLLPNYVMNKQYFTSIIQKAQFPPFYVSPAQKYPIIFS